MLLVHCNNHVKSGMNQNDSQIITRIKSFVNKYNWERINYPSEKYGWKNFEKNHLKIPWNVLYAKKEKGILLMVQNITQILKNQLFFSWLQMDKDDIILQWQNFLHY